MHEVRNYRHCSTAPLLLAILQGLFYLLFFFFFFVLKPDWKSVTHTQPSNQEYTLLSHVKIMYCLICVCVCLDVWRWYPSMKLPTFTQWAGGELMGENLYAYLVVGSDPRQSVWIARHNSAANFVCERGQSPGSSEKLPRRTFLKLEMILWKSTTNAILCTAVHISQCYQNHTQIKMIVTDANY